MTIYRYLHPRDNVDGLHLPRKEGGRGLISMEDCVDIEKLSLKEYEMQSNEKLISAVKGNEGRKKRRKKWRKKWKMLKLTRI